MISSFFQVEEKSVEDVAYSSLSDHPLTSSFHFFPFSPLLPPFSSSFTFSESLNWQDSTF